MTMKESAIYEFERKIRTFQNNVVSWLCVVILMNDERRYFDFDFDSDDDDDDMMNTRGFR